MYSPIDPYDNGDLRETLGSLRLTELPEEASSFLDAVFREEEVVSAIGSFPSGKAPGPGGLPIEWYHQYSETLAPRLLQLYADCLQTGSLPLSFYEAHIVLLAKPDKDPLQCSSYRPISLLNMDFKILTKLLARLMLVLQHVVSPDQTGFMPKKATDINLRRVFTHTQLGPNTSSGGILVFLDLEKVFDPVDWNYMRVVLEVFGFGPQFRKWIDILYHCPTAAIKLNNMLSEFFLVRRGTRQGCPLSPGLFSIMIEPLAMALRASEEVQGIMVGSLTEKTALYAEDMVLFLRDSKNSLSAALDIPNSFARFRV